MVGLNVLFFLKRFENAGYELWFLMKKIHTGKSFSEALILASTNPRYDKRLFIVLQAQYMKIASSEHDVSKKQETICVNNMFWLCSELAIFIQWTICGHTVG